MSILVESKPCSSHTDRFSGENVNKSISIRLSSSVDDVRNKIELNVSGHFSASFFINSRRSAHVCRTCASGARVTRPVSPRRAVSQASVDPGELRRFRALARTWWDERGAFAALHAMNELRVPFIRSVFVHNSPPAL